MSDNEEIEDIIESDEEFEAWIEQALNEEETSSTDEDKEKIDFTNEEEISKFLVEPPDDIDIESMNEIQREMFENIKEMDKSSWMRGEGIKCQYEKLNEKLCGIQPGFTLLGAHSNTGKTSFLMSIAFGVGEVNDDVLGLYISLDDRFQDILPRVVSNKMKIPINAIRQPASHMEWDNLIKKRNKGIRDVLYRNIDSFKVIDKNQVKNLKELKKIIKNHYNYCNEVGKKLFVAIDSFHDIEMEENFRRTDDKWNKLPKEISDFADELDIPIWCSAELKKTDFSKFRPDQNDIKFASKIAFEAKLILILYNEVGLESGDASIYYTSDQFPGKMPVLEVRFEKNKLSSYKGNLYYEFIPQYAHFEESNTERYDSLLYSD